MESFFTRNDATKVEAPKKEQYRRKVQETKKVNIRTIEYPKLINFWVTYLEEETLLYIDHFREFSDVSWS